MYEVYVITILIRLRPLSLLRHSSIDTPTNRSLVSGEGFVLKCSVSSILFATEIHVSPCSCYRPRYRSYPEYLSIKVIRVNQSSNSSSSSDIKVGT